MNFEAIPRFAANGRRSKTLYLYPKSPSEISPCRKNANIRVLMKILQTDMAVWERKCS